MTKKTVSENLASISDHLDYMSNTFDELKSVVQINANEVRTAAYLSVLKQGLVGARYTFDLIKEGSN